MNFMLIWFFSHFLQINRNPFLFFILVFILARFCNCNNICRIYIFNDIYEAPKYNLNYENDNNYSSLLKAISEINKCDNSKNEVIFELQTDYIILSSYEIDFYNESLSLKNYFLFSYVSSNIKKITIKCFNCTDENPTEIAIKDQKISFWIDREINFINLNFTGIDINLKFNETLHNDCYFRREGCCPASNSCLMEHSYDSSNKDAFYKISLFQIEEEGNLIIINTSFSFFESYLVNRTFCFQSLIYIHKATNFILFEKSLLDIFYFEKGIILMDNSVLNLTLNKTKISNYGNKALDFGLTINTFLDIIFSSKVYMFNILFETINCETFINLDKSFLTIENFHINDQNMQNTTLFQMTDHNFLKLKHLQIYNSTFSSLILANVQNSILVISSNLKNVSFLKPYTIFLNNSNEFYAKSFFFYEVYNTKYQLFFNIGNSAIFYENFFILIGSIFDPEEYNRGLFNFNYSNKIFLIKCHFSQIKDSQNSWLYFTKANTIILKSCLFSDGYFEYFCGVLFSPSNFDEAKSFYIVKNNIIMNFYSQRFNGFQISDANIIFEGNIYFNLNSLFIHCSLMDAGSIIMKNERVYKSGSSTISGEKVFFSFIMVIIQIVNCTLFDSGSRNTFFISSNSLSKIIINTISFSNSEIGLLQMTTRNIILIINTLLRSIEVNFNEFIYFLPAKDDPNIIIIKDCYFFIFSGNYFNFDASIFLLINVVFESQRFIDSYKFFQRPILEFVDSSIIKIKNNTFIDNFAIFSIATNNTLIVLNSKVINRNQENSLSLFVDADYLNKIILLRLRIIGFRSSQISKGIIVITTTNIIAIKNNYICLRWMKKKHEGIFSLIFSNIFNSIILKKINIQLEGFLYFFSCLMNNFITLIDIHFKSDKIKCHTLFSIKSSEFLIKNAIIENLICSLFESIKSNVKVKHVVAKNISHGFGIVKQGNLKIIDFKLTSKFNRFLTFFYFLESLVFLNKIEVVELFLFSNSSLFKIFSSNFFINASLIWIAKTLDNTSSIFSVTGKSDYFYIKKCDFSFNLVTILEFYYFKTDIFLFTLVHFRKNLDRSRSSTIIKKSQINLYLIKNHFLPGRLNENLRNFTKFSIYSEDSNLKIKLQENKGSDSQINFYDFIFVEKFENEFNFSNKNIIFSEEIYADAFFISDQGQREKSLVIQNLTLQENYKYCLAVIQLYDSFNQLIQDQMSNFSDLFKITNILHKNEQMFSFQFNNVRGSFCLQANYEAVSFIIQYKTLTYQIELRNNINVSPLRLTIEYNKLCSSNKYLDQAGKCKYCPKNTFKRTLIKISDLELKFPNLDCLPCYNSNGFLCFGENKYAPLPNFWEINGEPINFLKCPFKNTCKGDNRKFKNDENFIYDDKYKAGFCYPNYKGILCLECQSNYGKWFDFECESCFSYLNYVNLGIQIAIKLFTNSFFIVVLCKISENLENNNELLLQQQIYQTFNIFIQVLNSIVSIEPRHFIYFRKAINFFLIFTSNLDFTLAYECFFSDKNNKKFFFMLCLRILFLISSFVVAILLFLFKIKRKFIRSKKITLFFLKKIFPIIIVSLVFLFSYTMIEFCTNIFFCIEAKQDSRSIKIALYDPNMDCKSLDYRRMLILSIVILLIFVYLNFTYISLVISKFQEYEIFSAFFHKRDRGFDLFFIIKYISPLLLNAFLNCLRYFSIFYYEYSTFLLNFIIVFQVLLFIITFKMRKNMISFFECAINIELNLLLFSILFFSVYRIDLFQSSSKNSIFFDLLSTILLISLIFYHLFLKKLLTLLVIRSRPEDKYYLKNDIEKISFDFSEFNHYLKKMKSLLFTYMKKKNNIKQLLKIYKFKNFLNYVKAAKGNIKNYLYHHKINFNFLKENEIEDEIEFSRETKFSFKIIKYMEIYYFFIINKSESKLFWKSIDILSYKKCKNYSSLITY